MVRLLASAWRLRALALGAALSLAFAVFGAASVGAGAAQPGTLFPGSSELGQGRSLIPSASSPMPRRRGHRTAGRA
jgi:hypothetical protein